MAKKKKARKPKSPLNQAIAELVRKKREELKISQEQVGAYIGTSRAYIGQIELRESDAKYNLDHLYLLSIYFGCPITDLLPTGHIEEEFINKPAKKYYKPKRTYTRKKKS